MSELLQESEEQNELEAHLAAAKAAYDASDSEAFAPECQAAIDLDPENPEAWRYLAEFGAWDAKYFKLDIDSAIDAIQHAFRLTDESKHFELASRVYDARKRQIAYMLDEAMLNLTTKGSSRIHEIMQCWLRFLSEIPSLSPEIIEGEINLCENLCKRSRIGIMPTDRMVYTAYMDHNGKETYGKTFRRALEGRLQHEQAEQEAALEEAHANAKAALDAATEHLNADSPELSLLQADATALQEAIDSLRSFTRRGLFEKQIEQLETQKQKLSGFQLMKSRAIAGRIASTKREIAKIDKDLKGEVGPLEEKLAEVREKIQKLQ